jgi:hypothetical protein
MGRSTEVTTLCQRAEVAGRAVAELSLADCCIDVDDHGLIVRLPPPSTRAPGSRRRTLDRWMEESWVAWAPWHSSPSTEMSQRSTSTGTGASRMVAADPDELGLLDGA